MSEVSEEASVKILLAEYAATDPAGRVNIVGNTTLVVGPGGLPGQGLAPGFTPPFSVVAIVTVPPRLTGQESSVELQLEDAAGDAVAIPGATGEPQVMRVAQAVTFEDPVAGAPGAGVPRRTLRPRFQWVLNFPGGLPLALSQLYTWRVKIDMSSRDDWCEQMYVAGPPPGPVIG